MRDPDFGGAGSEVLNTLNDGFVYPTLIPSLLTPVVSARARGAYDAGPLQARQVLYAPEPSGMLVQLAGLLGQVSFTRSPKLSAGKPPALARPKSAALMRC